ncbi:hypothetical protein ACH5RR_005477 [Cinchona calisaya]|uniref:Uncharacterized protein n=1 Tax=Cinchona calisaya TaxID=153742 RepID=A0ABD3ALB8_9GENT
MIGPAVIDEVNVVVAPLQIASNSHLQDKEATTHYLHSVIPHCNETTTVPRNVIARELTYEDAVCKLETHPLRVEIGTAIKATFGQATAVMISSSTRIVAAFFLFCQAVASGEVFNLQTTSL